MGTNTTNKGKRDEIKDILLKINMQTESRKKGVYSVPRAHVSSLWKELSYSAFFAS
jgi:hypothetical protein